MATPMSARRSAGASLTPSPVIATTWPAARSASAMRSLASGELRAKTTSAPEPSSVVQLGLGHRVELGAGDHLHPAGADADLAGDRRGGQPVVAGDHVDPDARPVHLPDRGRDLGAGRVEHRDQPEQAQVPFGVRPLAGDCPIRRGRRAAAERRAPAARAGRSRPWPERPAARSAAVTGCSPWPWRIRRWPGPGPPRARPWCARPGRRPAHPRWS